MFRDNKVYTCVKITTHNNKTNNAVLKQRNGLNEKVLLNKQIPIVNISAYIC